MELRFAYRADALLLSVVFGLGIPLFLIGVAWAATATIVTQGSLALSPTASVVFNMVVALIGLALIGWGVRMVRAREREIIVSPTRVSAPRSPASARSESIPVSSIRAVTTGHSSSWGIHLELTIEDRHPVRLHRRFFADPAAFHACVEAMTAARAGRLS